MVCVLAFSVQHEVEKYGAYVGIASFLGLALLSILYFAQAREVRRLRDWAGRAPERDAELEARVTSQAQDARRRQVAPAARPAVPVSVSEATQVTPAPVPSGNGHSTVAPLTVPMGPRPATAAAAVAAAVGAAEAQAAPAANPEAGVVTAPDAAPEPKPESAPVAPAPLAPSPGDGEDTSEHDALTDEEDEAAGTNGTGDVAAVPRATPRPAAPAPPGPATAAARRPAQAARVADRSATVPPRRPAPRTGRPARPAPAPAAEGRGRGRGILIGVVAGVVVLAVAALLVTHVLGGGGGTTAKPNTTEPAATSTAGSTPAAGGPAVADTVVVILNGTTTDGLAAKAKTTLEQAGYASSNIPTDTGPNQATQQSTVAYAPGRRRQAVAVARALKIARVGAVDSGTQSLADNSSDPPVKADVVVVLGADRTP
jgi:hypothetical protein